MKITIEVEEPVSQADLNWLRSKYGKEIYMAEECDYDAGGAFGTITGISA